MVFGKYVIDICSVLMIFGGRGIVCGLLLKGDGEVKVWILLVSRCWIVGGGEGGGDG